MFYPDNWSDFMKELETTNKKLYEKLAKERKELGVKFYSEEEIAIYKKQVKSNTENKNES